MRIAAALAALLAAAVPAVAQEPTQQARTETFD